MGTTDVDAGPHHVTDAQGASLGYRWFYGSSSDGHLGPSGDPVTSPAATNAIIAAAGTSEAAMLSAMPAWLSTWVTGLKPHQRTRFYREVKYHPGVM